MKKIKIVSLLLLLNLSLSQESYGAWRRFVQPPPGVVPPPPVDLAVQRAAIRQQVAGERFQDTILGIPHQGIRTVNNPVTQAQRLLNIIADAFDPDTAQREDWINHIRRFIAQAQDAARAENNRLQHEREQRERDAEEQRRREAEGQQAAIAQQIEGLRNRIARIPHPDNREVAGFIDDARAFLEQIGPALPEDMVRDLIQAATNTIQQAEEAAARIVVPPPLFAPPPPVVVMPPPRGGEAEIAHQQEELAVLSRLREDLAHQIEGLERPVMGGGIVDVQVFWRDQVLDPVMRLLPAPERLVIPPAQNPYAFLHQRLLDVQALIQGLQPQLGPLVARVEDEERRKAERLIQLRAEQARVTGQINELEQRLAALAMPAVAPEEVARNIFTAVLRETLRGGFNAEATQAFLNQPIPTAEELQVEYDALNAQIDQFIADFTVRSPDQPERELNLYSDLIQKIAQNDEAVQQTLHSITQKIQIIKNIELPVWEGPQRWGGPQSWNGRALFISSQNRPEGDVLKPWTHEWYTNLQRFFVLSLCLFVIQRYRTTLDDRLETFVNHCYRTMCLLLLQGRAESEQAQQIKILHDRLLEKTGLIKINTFKTFRKALPHRQNAFRQIELERDPQPQFLRRADKWAQFGYDETDSKIKLFYCPTTWFPCAGGAGLLLKALDVAHVPIDLHLRGLAPEIDPQLNLLAQLTAIPHTDLVTQIPYVTFYDEQGRRNRAQDEGGLTRILFTDLSSAFFSYANYAEAEALPVSLAPDHIFADENVARMLLHLPPPKQLPIVADQVTAIKTALTVNLLFPVSKLPSQPLLPFRDCFPIHDSSIEALGRIHRYAERLTTIYSSFGKILFYSFILSPLFASVMISLPEFVFAHVLKDNLTLQDYFYQLLQIEPQRLLAIQNTIEILVHITNPQKFIEFLQAYYSTDRLNVFGLYEVDDNVVFKNFLQAIDLRHFLGNAPFPDDNAIENVLFTLANDPLHILNDKKENLLSIISDPGRPLVATIREQTQTPASTVAYCSTALCNFVVKYLPCKGYRATLTPIKVGFGNHSTALRHTAVTFITNACAWAENLTQQLARGGAQFLFDMRTRVSANDIPIEHYAPQHCPFGITDEDTTLNIFRFALRFLRPSDCTLLFKYELSPLIINQLKGNIRLAESREDREDIRRTKQRIFAEILKPTLDAKLDELSRHLATEEHKQAANQQFTTFVTNLTGAATYPGDTISIDIKLEPGADIGVIQVALHTCTKTLDLTLNPTSADNEANIRTSKEAFRDLLNTELMRNVIGAAAV